MRGFALAFAVVALVACGGAPAVPAGQTGLAVTVKMDPQPTFDRLVVTISPTAGQTAEAVTQEYPVKSVTLPGTLIALLPDWPGGALRVDVEARNGQVVVAQGGQDTSLARGQAGALTVNLSPPTGPADGFKPGNVGAACTADAQCGTGSTVRCVVTAPNPNGVCTADGCDDAEHACGENNSCVNGQCVRSCDIFTPCSGEPAVACDPASDACVPGCTMDAQCGDATTLYCSASLHVCLNVGNPAGQPGGPCASDVDCPKSGFCYGAPSGQAALFPGGFCTTLGCDFGGDLACAAPLECILPSFGNSGLAASCLLPCTSDGDCPVSRGYSCKQVMATTPNGDASTRGFCFGQLPP